MRCSLSINVGVFPYKEWLASGKRISCAIWKTGHRRTPLPEEPLQCPYQYPSVLIFPQEKELRRGGRKIQPNKVFKMDGAESIPRGRLSSTKEQLSQCLHNWLTSRTKASTALQSVLDSSRTLLWLMCTKQDPISFPNWRILHGSHFFTKLLWLFGFEGPRIYLVLDNPSWEIQLAV